LGTGLRMYAQDNDDRLPSASRWMDRSRQYTRTWVVYHCPEVGGAAPESCGYALNSRLSGADTSRIRRPGSVALACDSRSTARNASAPGLDGLASPPRHAGPMNWVLYLDGRAGAAGRDGPRSDTENRQ
jgi:hypothetical protein